jgi:hypothetical protein
MKTDFDERIKEVYDSGEFEYNPANWKKLQERLHPVSEGNKSWKILGVLSIVTFKQFSAAASVIFALGLSVTYLNDPIPTLTSKNNQTIERTEINLDHNKKIDITNQSNLASAGQSRLKLNHRLSKPKFNSSLNNQFPLAFNQVEHSQNDKTHDSNIHIERSNLIVANSNNTPSDFIDENQQNDIEQVYNFDKPRKEYSSGLHQNPIVILPKENNSLDFDGLNFIGSIAKGAKNNAYAAGINYQTSIGNRFFIDGSVSLYSSYIQEVVMFNTNNETAQFKTGKPGSSTQTPTSNQSSTNSQTIQFKTLQNSPPAPAKKEEVQETKVRIQDASYAHLAINPSIGYKITNRISIKTGVDLQKRISNTNELSYVESNSNFQALPNYDVGVTPNVGININKHWQTNFAFRKGINNLISKKNYFNRDYFQLQLGYKF